VLINILYFCLLHFQSVCVLFAGRCRRPIAVECWSTPSTDDWLQIL